MAGKQDKHCHDGKRRYKYIPYNKRPEMTRCLTGCKKGWVRPTGHKLCEKGGKQTKGSLKVQSLNHGWLASDHIKYICKHWFGRTRKHTIVNATAPPVTNLSRATGRKNRQKLEEKLQSPAKEYKKVVFCITNMRDSHWVVVALTPSGKRFTWDLLNTHTLTGYTQMKCVRQDGGWQCGYHALWNLQTLLRNVATAGSEKGLMIDIHLRPSKKFIFNVHNKILDEGKEKGSLMLRKPARLSAISKFKHKPGDTAISWDDDDDDDDSLSLSLSPVS